MRKASKLLAIALAAVMALGFTGCGGSGCPAATPAA